MQGRRQFFLFRGTWCRSRMVEQTSFCLSAKDWSHRIGWWYLYHCFPTFFILRPILL